MTWAFFMDPAAPPRFWHASGTICSSRSLGWVVIEVWWAGQRPSTLLTVGCGRSGCCTSLLYSNHRRAEGYG